MPVNGDTGAEYYFSYNRYWSKSLNSVSLKRVDYAEQFSEGLLKGGSIAYD